MASRKDQLNAYNFARKRTVAAFLQPSPTGSEEGAPRPLRALGPSLIVGALALAVFGAWGLLQPAAPSGWDTPGQYVIVGSESTTRYVVLQDTGTDGKPAQKQLHPVLNFASAKLLLDPDKGQVIKVKESVLDSGKVPHGATIGIPYAPDRLPTAEDAGTPKHWAVCDRPSTGTGNAPDQAVFVLAGKEATTARGRMRLTGNQVLYVKDASDNSEYLVDHNGTRFPLGDPRHQDPARMPQLRSTLFGQGAQPQPVTRQWLKSLNPGSPIWFPDVGNLKASTPDGPVGTILEATSAMGELYYVVTEKGIEATNAFAALLIRDETGQPTAKRTTVPPGSHDRFTGAAPDWPAQEPRTVNVAGATGGPGTTVACSVLAGTANATGHPPLEVWAGNSYPATIVNGATSAYVTPGTGLLYVEVTGKDFRNGTLYLVTDTGLRYAVPHNNDSTAATPTPAPAPTAAGSPPVNLAQTRLGYGSVVPKGIPLAWSEFLPKGPTLDTESAMQAQGS